MFLLFWSLCWYLVFCQVNWCRSHYLFHFLLPTQGHISLTPVAFYWAAVTNPSLCTLFKTSPRNLGQHHQAHRQKRKTQYTLQRDINLSFCSLMLHQRSFIPGESHLFSVPPKGLSYSCGSQLLDTSACGLMKAWRGGGGGVSSVPSSFWWLSVSRCLYCRKRPILKCSFLNPDFFSSHCVCLLFVFILYSLTQIHASLYLCPTNLPHILHTFKLFPPAFTLVMSEFTIVV